MNWLTQTLITTFTAFAATNLDDLLVLVLFFAQINVNFRPYQIVAGQYLGFTTLVLLSLPGFGGGLIISPAWIGLLGLMPIALGLQQLIQPDSEDTAVPPIPTSSAVKAPNPYPPHFLARLKVIPPQIYQVAAVTVANGGDNIGIYVPLFASSDAATLGVILAGFMGLIAGWCWLAKQFTRHPAIARGLMQYGHGIRPFGLIGLGLYILVKSQSYRLVWPGG